jgi:hypothetical protein
VWWRSFISDCSAPQKQVGGAAVTTAEDCGTADIMCRSGKSKPVVWRRRFMAKDVERPGARQGAQAWPKAASGCHGAECRRPRSGNAAGGSNQLDRPDAYGERRPKRIGAPTRRQHHRARIVLELIPVVAASAASCIRLHCPALRCRSLVSLHHERQLVAPSRP